MLRYLMKYDLKKMLKLLVWFYAIAIVIASITRIINIWSNIQIMQIIGSIFMGLTYSAIATIFINTFIHILMRFTTSFYKDQSYLTHTLPVKKDTLILSKYISSLIVIFLSVFVSALSLFIVFYSPEFMANLKSTLNIVVAGFNMSSGLFVFLLIGLIFSQICALMSFAFTAIIKGYSYNHKRGFKGFLWFILYCCLCSFTILILTIIVSMITGDINSLFAEKMSSGAFLTVFIVGLSTYIVYALAFYYVGKKEFNKGVNVD